METIGLQQFAVLMLSVFLACSSHDSQAGGSMKDDPAGVLQGRLTVGPLHPGPVRIDEKEPEPPAELFASHRIVILATDGKTKVKEASLDSRGNFRVELPPGDYLIEVVPHIGMRKLAPSRVTIVTGKTTKFDLDIDTGMR